MALQDEVYLRRVRARAGLVKADEPAPRSGSCLSWALLCTIIVACIAAALIGGVV